MFMKLIGFFLAIGLHIIILSGLILLVKNVGKAVNSFK